MVIPWHSPVLPRLVAVCTAFVGAPAPAQDSQTLPETVVTAERVETPLEQVGGAITVISRADLENRQTRLVADILREVAGVSISQLGPAGQLSQARLRGAEANHTLVLIDGIKANDPATGSEFNFAYLQGADIERIEILRGPQSALWGSDAIGGVINIITRRGRGPLQGRASLEGGSFGTWRLNASAGGGGERYHYFLSGARLTTEGVSIAPAGSEKDGARNNTFSFKGGLKPLNNLSIDLVGRRTDAVSEFDPQDFSFPPGPTFGQVIDGDNEVKARQTYGRLQGKLTLFGGQWEHIVGAALTDTDSEFLEDGARETRSAGGRTQFDYQTNVFFATPNAAHTVVFAAERNRERFKQRGTVAEANQNQAITSRSYVGQYRIALADQVFLSGALRHDRNDRFANDTTFRLTAAYVQPAWQTRLHASYGTGVKNPTFTELFGFFPGTFIGNPALKPERSRGWDIGVEQPFADGRHSVDVTYFRANLEDEIVTTFDTNTFLSSVENLDGTSRRHGVEIQGRATLWRGLDLAGSYTYTFSEDAEGQAEIRRPKHLASLTLNYRFLDERANVNLGILYNGKREDLNFTTVPSSRATLDDYVLVNLRGDYRINKHLKVFGRIDNLLDEDYQDVFGYDTSGRGFYVGLEGSI